MRHASFDYLLRAKMPAETPNGSDQAGIAIIPSSREAFWSGSYAFHFKFANDLGP